ncbi:TioE family transcriptional regulator [Amycolatopsis endophytica]|uniref:DNA-binding transcriptional MerR regulator n=1 Tax=Amycolatopsis endophytica TaxID=860233 RepID=A0A853B0J2_9PSEU|nr:TioE family transcriptional regulator [Amycolatopsis endophytica]NYI88354.1 DNA-binding transcriptional MerR regulator [Amycolatopsis endophytica]
MKPSDLAREHGISTQAVRNYERDGFLPPADRTPSGYRVYTKAHAAALRTFLALIPAYGHAGSGQIMSALNDGRVDHALMLIDRGHSRLLQDRETLDSVRDAIDHLTAAPVPSRSPRDSLTIGELARRLRVTPATLRNWEQAGILTPTRDPTTAYRTYQAPDIRDAELTHLLRRGGYLLDHIAGVIRQIHTAGGSEPLARALGDWHRKLTAQALAMLHAATYVSEYVKLTKEG